MCGRAVEVPEDQMTIATALAHARIAGVTGKMAAAAAPARP